MKAAVYNEDGSIAIRQVELPELQDGWVQLAIRAVGICGTDLHIKNGALGSPAGIRPGHEIAALVEQRGDGVQIETGSAVVVEPVLGCGACQHCQSGMPNRCLGKDFFGYSKPGGLAELMQVPESLLQTVDRHLDPALAGRLREHHGRSGVGVGRHPPDLGRQDPSTRPRRPTRCR